VTLAEDSDRAKLARANRARIVATVLFSLISSVVLFVGSFPSPGHFIVHYLVRPRGWEDFHEAMLVGIGSDFVASLVVWYVVFGWIQRVQSK
jgi:hypothetical protein